MFLKANVHDFAFSFILVVFVVVFLFTCLPFLIMAFFVILSSMIICTTGLFFALFCVCTFVHNFNVKRCKRKAPAS